ncbi:MAG: hypothetical protein L0215_18705, partial [Gemmataceae bacterium]|nr:hypothetical protein [Gemmataceae bacterium]
MLISLRRLWNALTRRNDTSAKPAVKRRRRYRPFAEPLEDRVTPSVVLWDNEGLDGLWENPVNWSTNQLPGVLDSADIGLGFSITANSNVAVAGITCQSNVTFNGELSVVDAVFSSGQVVFNGDVHLDATLELDGTAVFNGVAVDGDGVVQLNGMATANGAVAFQNLDLVGATLAIGFGGTTTIYATMNFAAGEVLGAGVLPTLLIDAAATLNFVEEGDKHIDCAVENFGATAWTGGDIYSDAVTFTNKSGATFSIGEEAGNWTDAAGVLVNEGTLTSEGVQDPMGVGHRIGIEFNSANLVHVTSGILTLAAGGHLAGAVTIAGASSTVLGGGPFFLNPGLVVQGQGFMIQETDATVTGTVTAANYLLQ